METGRDRVFRPAQGRAVLLFWTLLGSALILAGIATFVLQAAAHGRVESQPALLVLGVLVVASVQVIYPAVTWLSVGRQGFVLRTVPGRRAVSWARVGSMEAVSALTPAGRGGTQGGVHVRDTEGRLILIVPDVFAVGRDGMLAILEAARSGPLLDRPPAQDEA